MYQRTSKSFSIGYAEGRYRQFMKSYAAEQILQRVPQHFIASYLGITPVSLSRIRARVADEEREKRKVIV